MDDNEKESEALAYLADTLDSFPKGNAWWLPPHNLCLNQALTAFNLWRFTILPLFPKKTAYDDTLKGFVIQPSWRPASEREFKGIDLDMAKKFVLLMQQEDTIQETVRKELSWIERTFSVRIPDSVQSKVIKDAQMAAIRRWGVNMLRMKKRLVPLDGGPSRDL